MYEYVSAQVPTVHYCETGEHYTASPITPGQMDPARGTTYIDSICENCTDDAVAAYYG